MPTWTPPPSDPLATIARLLRISRDEAAAMSWEQLVAARQRLADDLTIAELELAVYDDEEGTL